MMITANEVNAISWSRRVGDPDHAAAFYLLVHISIVYIDFRQRGQLCSGQSWTSMMTI